MRATTVGAPTERALGAVPREHQRKRKAKYHQTLPVPLTLLHAYVNRDVRELIAQQGVELPTDVPSSESI